MKDDPLPIPWYGSEPANRLGLSQFANTYVSECGVSIAYPPSLLDREYGCLLS